MKTLLFLFFFISSVRSDWPCPCNEYFIGGLCRPPICINLDGLPPCVTSCAPGQYPIQDTCINIPHCPDGLAALYGNCVPKCNSTESPNNNQCVICDVDSVWANGQCVPCPIGTRPTNNRCYLDCPSGYQLNDDGACEPACPFGEVASNGACVGQCLNNGKAFKVEGVTVCYPTCPAPLNTYRQQCVHECPANFRANIARECVTYYFHPDESQYQGGRG